ncbi:MAG TPA: hypothetical protein VET23_15420 [Chitinophagaceae bacterium]|nr:hypothetical protein [Chitinophagaceae bacterium]
MKKILMLALASTLTMGAFATDHKPKKQKDCKHCTQQKCTPDCKKQGGCSKSTCAKA